MKFGIDPGQLAEKAAKKGFGEPLTEPVRSGP
jgi:hypothetical protein